MKDIFMITRNDLGFARNEFILKALQHLKITPIMFNNDLSFLKRQVELVKCFINNRKCFKNVLLTPRCKNDLLMVKALSLLFRKKLIVDVFISSYDTLVEDRKLYPKNGVMATFLKIFDKMVIASANVALLDTYEHINYFKENISKKGNYHRVIMGSDKKRHKPHIKHKTEENETFNIIYNGTYIPLHGVEFIISAAKKLKDENIQFRLFGDGQVYPEMKEKVRSLGLKNVKFVKEFTEQELLDAIGNSDIFLGVFGDTNKAKRVIPTKVFKGMALRKCIITGKCKAMEEIFTEGEDYIGVNFADSEDLKNKIQFLKKNRDIINEIENKSYDSFCQKGDISSVAKELHEIL
jgi:glycosyltransferase involved in cell wall biosynthesis